MLSRFLVFKGGLLHVPLAPHDGTLCSTILPLHFVTLYGVSHYGAAPHTPALYDGYANTSKS